MRNSALFCSAAAAAALVKSLALSYHQVITWVVCGQRDASLDALLDLDGQVLVLDEKGEYWVKFQVKRVTPTTERPHGLDYSITLHGNDNERLVGFDNAHAIRQSAGPGGKGKPAFDHKHRVRTIRPYEYRDAATLLADFWAEVDAVLTERGVEL